MLRDATARGRYGAAALACAAALVGCDPRPAPAPVERASATEAATSSAVIAPPSAAPERSAAAPGVRSACRVVRVTGRVVSAGAELAPGALAADWVEAEAGATVFLKHTVSGREFELAGPGRFVACPGGEEAVIAARGRATVLPGAGERPGAEVVLATPAGTVSAAGGKASVTVTVAGGEILGVAEVEGTEAWTRLAAGARRIGPERLGGGGRRGELRRPARGAGAALAGACEEAADRARAAAAAVVSPGPGLGERAARHVAERQAARHACAVARAAADLEGERARDALLGRVEAAERAARELPVPPGAPAPAGSGP